ncbi:MAG: hypothetical protein ACKOXQ_00170 [Hydrogenophaga sp.]
MLTWIVAAKAVTEIALLALLGQGVLGLLGRERLHRNPFYRVLQVIGSPFVWLARRLSPRRVLDRHVPLVAFVLLAWGWVMLTWLKLSYCLSPGATACR